jgi:hypothetical protein
MGNVGINQHNVGRIAERIVSNELEYNGFRVSDLNKEGTSANADLLAAKHGKTWQIQVKGATEGNGWWVNYGFGGEGKIDGREPMFNAVSSFYVAQVVVLVCVKSPSEYRCVVLPVGEAERAAQLNLDHAYRKANLNGTKKRPGKVWVSLGYIPKPRDASRLPILKEEQEILSHFIGNWDIEKNAVGVSPVTGSVLP